MRQFAFVLRPAIDQAFMEAAGPRELAVVEEHWQYLLELDRQVHLVVAGCCFDGPFAIVVFEAEDEAAAQAVVDADPSVAEGIQTAELYPFKIGLLRGGQ